MTASDILLPRFAVIIPSYNRPDRLRALLLGLAKLDYEHERWEILVVDDGSIEPLESATSDIALPVPVRFYRQSNTGSGGARNLAAKATQMEYLAFTADDCIPDRKWLSELSIAFSIKGSEDALVGGAISHAIPNNRYATASHLLIEYITANFNAQKPSFFTPNNLAVHRDSFLNAGGFSDSIGATGEDREFCARWLSQGRRMRFLPSAVVEHNHPLSFRGFVLQHYSYGIGSARYRQLRESDSQARPRTEPLKFYLRLISCPFRTDYPQKTTLTLLLVISQVANAAGVVRETLWPRVKSG
jgi:GT2 family glycosyltransferase